MKELNETVMDRGSALRGSEMKCLEGEVSWVGVNGIISGVEEVERAREIN